MDHMWLVKLTSAELMLSLITVEESTHELSIAMFEVSLELICGYE